MGNNATPIRLQTPAMKERLIRKEDEFIRPVIQTRPTNRKVKRPLNDRSFTRTT